MRHHAQGDGMDFGMADPLDDVDLDWTRPVEARGTEPDSAAAQVRRALRGKHVCPFCGTTRETDLGPCQQCSLEDTPATRAATRSKLGPWYVLQSRNPSAPGMSFTTLLTLVQKNRVTARSVIRGPTTAQFWRHAAKVKGISREFGLCWNCGGDVANTARVCPACKRLQDPPINPDVLLETGESTEDLAEQMWAADVAPTNGDSQSPRQKMRGSVDDLISRGGVRRQVPASVPEVALSPVAAPASLSPAMAPRNGVVADGEHELHIPNQLEVAVFGSPYRDPTRPAPRPHGKHRVFKAFVVALLMGGLGFGAMCYFDPSLRRNSVDWWHHTVEWIQGQKKHEPKDNAKPDDADASIAGARFGPESQPGETLSMKAHRLARQGDEEALKGNFGNAIAKWESVKALPRNGEMNWPVDLNRKIEETRRRMSTTQP